jgi:hypothetical protein
MSCPRGPLPAGAGAPDAFAFVAGRGVGLSLLLCLGVAGLSGAPLPAFSQELPGTPTQVGASPGAQDVPDSRSLFLRASRTPTPPVIDGMLDDAVWGGAEVATGFRQVEPEEAEPAREGTEVRILYDDDNLYIGARMWDADPASIQRQLTRRSEEGDAYDYFEVSLDPNGDGRTGYTFRVTAAGVQVDRFHFDDTDSDVAWEAVWESAVRLDPEGWTAELRIPLSQIRYRPSAATQVWGLQFSRRKVSTNERSDWAYVPPGVHGVVSRWGRLEGMELTHRARSLELAPFVAANVELGPTEPGNPFFDGRATSGRAGMDLRYGLGSTFVLDATLLPDFGQVEVDPRVVNLTAFETFFPERRPFFSRDDRLFRFGLSGGPNNLFYSRRIGRSPQGRPPPGAAFVDSPSETAILGAAKVTGRTEGGLTVGVLGALANRERGTIYRLDEDRFERYEAEPRTRYGTVRLQQELREGESVVGMILTSMHRELPGDGALDVLPRSAYSAGVDFEHNWHDRTWALWGFLAGSRVQGEPAALERIQRAPNHYHQRPDQDFLTLDPTRTSMAGAEWRLQFERRGGRNWTGALWAAQRTPGFEVNDLGFSTAPERLDGGARISYRQPTPGRYVRNWNASLVTFHNWRHSALDDLFSSSAWGEAHKAGRVGLNSGFTLMNWWGGGLGVGWIPQVRSENQTRGGPLMVRPGAVEFTAQANSDRRRPWVWQSSLSIQEGQFGSWSRAVSMGIEARPASGLLLSLDPNWQRSREVDQYVATFQDPGFTDTFGRRYVVAELERSQFTLDTRLNVILSPTLSFQMFAQPLLSAGEFVTYKELQEPGTFRFRSYVEGTAAEEAGGVRCLSGDLCRSGGRIHLDWTGDGQSDGSFPEQNFNLRSLRGSAVLRWEYRPGSQIYLVWQQNRQERLPVGDFNFSRDLRGLQAAPMENVFVIKASRWLTL